MINQILLLFSIIILFSTLMIILSVNSIHSIYWLVLIFFLASLSLICLKFNFIGFMLIIIYIGAITILFLFVIMMIDIIDIKLNNNNIFHFIFIILITINLLILNYYIIFKKLNFEKNIFYFNTSWELKNFHHLEIMGLLVYNSYFFSFIILSVILLIGLISAITLTLDINLKSKKQSLYYQHQRNNSWI